MIDARECTLAAHPGALPRRRFLRRLGGAIGGLLVGSWALGPVGGRPVRGSEQPRVPRERALAEADLYGPHDLAG